jgi:5'-3' exoribonuclease 2
MRPSFDTFAAPTPVNPLPSQKAVQEKAFETGSKALGGSNSDIVANRSAIRMANMTAAEALKAELASLKPLKPKANASKPAPTTMAPPPPLTTASTAIADDGGIPGLEVIEEPVASGPTDPEPPLTPTTDTINSPDLSASASVAVDSSATSPSSIGVKRKLDEIDNSSLSGVVTPLDEEEDSQETAPVKTRIVHADGTVESEDTVR